MLRAITIPSYHMIHYTMILYNPAAPPRRGAEEPAGAEAPEGDRVPRLATYCGFAMPTLGYTANNSLQTIADLLCQR